MKDLTKVFIDLSKCSEEQRKLLPQKVNVFPMTAGWLSEGRKDKSNPFLTYDEGCWIGSAKFHTEGLSELTYPEFIKLFEGGEIPDPTAQLQADKEEMLEALEKISKSLEEIWDEDEDNIVFDEIDAEKLDSLIQKHKQ